MQEKRYQIFISSTFEDLREERRAVQDVVISNGDFPFQMESFPAVDEDQFEFIKTVIDGCDFYILIIAGRYGSLASDGVSYTEKEYIYAVEKGVPVLVMLHRNRGNIAVEKSETTQTGIERLENFINRVQVGRLTKTWDNIDNLKLAVRESLDYAKATKQRIGWIRGDAAASVDILLEINNIRKENEELKRYIGNAEVEIDVPELPNLDSFIDLQLVPVEKSFDSVSGVKGSSAKIRVSWRDIFPIFLINTVYEKTYDGEKLYCHVLEERSCRKIASVLAGKISKEDCDGLFDMDKIYFEKLRSYYIEVGLMNPGNSGKLFTDFAEKIARRSIIIDEEAVFEVVSGKIEVVHFDYDIPF